MLTTHPLLAVRLRMTGALPPPTWVETAIPFVTKLLILSNGMFSVSDIITNYNICELNNNSIQFSFINVPT